MFARFLKEVTIKKFNLNRLNQPSHYSRAFSINTRFLKACLDCGNEIDQKLICPFKDCGSIQPPPYSTNYFEFFELNPSYKIDPQSLRLKFFDIQRKTHPDNFYSKTNAGSSEDLSSWVNKAYETLKNPLSRAIYLLELNQVYIGESMELRDQSILLEIMELNEAIEDAQNADALHKIIIEVKVKLRDLENQIASEFDNKNYKESQRLVINFKYFQNTLLSAQKRQETI
ncbi:hypothetical protein DSO57_1033028 [Entomophthora muscae]|uniref:Uncharacterized protein n=1 Tax=Entomophthora muscae TaxID=34485 RepID=A0ACC2SP62_9FUNG|nr:hypothetical protein DSO57_1033028 [Entomophthora muscae]